MYLLNTDHVSVMQSSLGEATKRIANRLLSEPEPATTCIITIEEIMRGWMAELRRLKQPADQIRAYDRLRATFGFFAGWTILPWDEPAASKFAELRSEGVRVGTMDLKIACIALVRDATLLTRNLRDFERVPGLLIEDWVS